MPRQPDPSHEDKILQHFRENPGVQLTAYDVAQKLRIGSYNGVRRGTGTATRVLARMARNGLLTRTPARGQHGNVVLYGLAGPGQVD